MKMSWGQPHAVAMFADGESGKLSAAALIPSGKMGIRARRVNSNSGLARPEVGDLHWVALLVDKALVHVDVLAGERVSQEDESVIDVSLLEGLVALLAAGMEDDVLKLVVKDVAGAALILVIRVAVLEVVTNHGLVLLAVVPGLLLNNRHSSSVEEVLAELGSTVFREPSSLIMSRKMAWSLSGSMFRIQGILYDG